MNIKTIAGDVKEKKARKPKGMINVMMLKMIKTFKNKPLFSRTPRKGKFTESGGNSIEPEHIFAASLNLKKYEPTETT